MQAELYQIFAGLQAKNGNNIPDTPSLMKAISDGFMPVEFDANIKEADTAGDHGTKFRIRPENPVKLYVESTKPV